MIVTWQHPQISTLHGPLIGYRLLLHDTETAQMKEYLVGWELIFKRKNNNSQVRKSDVNSYEMNDLKVYHQYSLSLSADNNFGYSPSDARIFRTQEGKPGTPPDKIKAELVDVDVINIQWEPPRIPNGKLIHYTVYFHHEPTEILRAKRQQMDKIIGKRQIKVGSEQENVEYNLTTANAFETYTIWLTASTQAGEGPRSELVRVVTDTKGGLENTRFAFPAPTPPSIDHISVSGQQARIHWTRPQRVYRKVDKYLVQLQSDDGVSENISQSQLNAGTEQFVSVFSTFGGRLS